MTATLTAKRFLLGLDTWANETANPNAAGGTAAEIGSLWQRNGSYPSRPTELYLKLNSHNTGWVHQNLVNLNVFNVIAYGAIGNGVADDTAAINLAIAACHTAGGGIVYFPPGTYKVTKPLTGFGSIQLTNLQNITFLGDGYSSLISMIGDAGAGAWYMFRVRNCQHLKWINLNMNSNGVTNVDPAKQHHLIAIDPQIPDAGGISDIDVIGCWWTGSIGDCVRPLGNSPNLCVDVRVMYNACTPLPTFKVRAFIEGQRFTQRVQCHYNWLTGSQDNIIDFEPTGGAGFTTAGPTEWSIVGNHINMNDSPSDAITFSGISTVNPSVRTVLQYNTTTDSGPISGLNVDGIVVVGNVFVMNAAIGAAVLEFNRFVQHVAIDSNVLISQDATGDRSALSFQNGNGSVPKQITVTNNICQALGDNAGGVALFIEANEITIEGNIVTMNVTLAGNGYIVRAGPQQVADVDHISVIGNLGIGVNQALTAGVDFHGLNGFNIHNTAALYNFFDNCQASVVWDRGATETFLDWRIANGNNSVVGTTGNIGAPGTNVGVTIEGSAGPGSQIAFINVAAGPEGNVSAPAGSLCVNQAGGDASILTYKETGVGVSGGSTGWLRAGPAEVNMGALASSTATAARFFAPGGLGLVVETATEIQWTVTRPGRIRNLRGKMVAGTGGGTNTFTLRLNGVDTTVTFGILNSQTSGSDTTHSFAVVAGDLISLSVAKSVAPATPQTDLIFTFEMTG